MQRVRAATVLVLVLAALGGCGSDPVQPANRGPVIRSLVAFPEIIGPSDSLIVFCDADDPDGDSLYYDWFTDGRLRIKDARPGDNSLYRTRSHSRVFYYQIVRQPEDTALVQCIVHDDRGGSYGRITRVVMR